MTFDFPSNTANPTFFRTYSRLKEDFKTKESVTDVFERGLSGLFKLGDYTTEEQELIRKNLYSLHTLFSGRWLWVGGKEFLEKPKNFYASYNCIGMSTEGLQDFGRCFNLLMQGCGVGASITEPELANLPPIISGITLLDITDQEGIGSRTTGVQDYTYISDNIMYVGDSREAWVDAILNILSMATTEGEWQIFIDLKSPRKAGTPIKGFGGVANPTDLRQLFIDIIEMLNSYVGCEWDSFLAAWLYGRVAKCTVAGNVRRSAELMQGSENDTTFTDMKAGMWQQTPEGKWIIDPKKDPLRMANHSRMFFHKPSYQDLEDAVRKQYYSGEGAIAYAPMAIIRCNVDLLDTDGKQNYFHALYLCDPKKALDYLSEIAVLKGLVLTPEELHHRIERWRANPCFRGDMRLLTTEGYKTFEELCGTEPLIINAKGETVRSKVWCSGEKEVVQVKLSNRESIFCTPDHRFLVNDEEVFAKDLKGKRLTPFLQKPTHQNLPVLLGFMQGDGTLTKDQTKLGETVNIGDKDSDIQALFDAEGFTYQTHHKGRILYVNNFASFIDDYGFKRVPTPYRTLPTSYFSSTKQEKAAFLSGLYSANGSVLTTGNRISFKTTSLDLANELLETLFDDFGIEAYITTNQSKANEFENGVYLCRESYDVNIAKYVDKVAFFNEINFVQKYKVENLATLLSENAPIVTSVKPAGVEKVYDFTEPRTHWGVVEGFIVHNCVEVLGKDFLCNLAEVHLNQLDPLNLQQQKEAFQSGGLITASLLAHVFDDEKFRYSREIDPIVGVSITGLFDFFVNLFGVDWLKWWQAGRPEEWIPEANQQLQNVWFVTDCYPEEPRGNIYRRIEQKYLSFWRDTAMKAVWDYCDRNGLRRPNRVTVVQPAGTKSLLTGASCGYHPPKASRYIRRITFAKNDPIALACIDYGYTVVPSQSDKNENGELLDNPFDPRCTEWLVEIPVEVAWASIADEAQLDPNHFSAAAQFDFFMQVQTYYTQHNTSSTIELREHEISELAKAIYTAIQTNQPYFSTALLSRFDSFESFPRLPFEPVSKEKYEELVASVLARRKSEDFYALMSQYQKGVEFEDDRGSVACESEVCSINKR